MTDLLDNSTLEKSSIVANSLMNRRRKCFGGNSYQKELSFDILEFLKNRLRENTQVSWLDICCGEGQALVEAAENFKSESRNLKIIGIDLAGMFKNIPSETGFLRLVEMPFESYFSESEFDLITCVHGFHYIGDKLASLQKAVSMLKNDGVFLANLDLENFKFEKGKNAKRTIAKSLRENGFEFDSKKHLLSCIGKKQIRFNFKYLGADDSAGANYTGQPVVDSFYRNLLTIT